MVFESEDPQDVWASMIPLPQECVFTSCVSFPPNPHSNELVGWEKELHFRVWAPRRKLYKNMVILGLSH